MADKEQISDEEPFLLTILPFVGLGLLLVLAVVWRVLPSKATEPGAGPQASPEEIIAVAISRWEQASTREIPIDPKRDFIIGPEDARVTLVEFSDFECPYCRNAANGAHDILEKYGNDVRLVFKNFPLDTTCNEQMGKPLHRFACRAATLAWCAGQQSESLFWDTHDAFFREPKITAETIERIPDAIGVDQERLDACMEGTAATEAVKEDIAQGRRVGITGTPVFFANGRKVSDYRLQPLEAVVAHILEN